MSDLASEVITSLLLVLMATIAAGMRLVLKRLKSVSDEQKPNGGSSMRDSIEKIKSEVLNISVNVDRLSAQIRGSLELENGGYFLTDEKGQCLWTSTVWQQLTGIGGDDARGEGWLRGFHADDQLRVWESWQMSIRLRQKFEMKYRTAKGIAVLGRAVELHDSNGAVVGNMGVITPVEG